MPASDRASGTSRSRNPGDYRLLRPAWAVLRDDLLAVPRFRLGAFALFFVTRFRLRFAEPLFFAARPEEEDLPPLECFFAPPLILLPKSLVFFAARTVERAVRAAACAPAHDLTRGALDIAHYRFAALRAFSQHGSDDATDDGAYWSADGADDSSCGGSGGGFADRRDRDGLIGAGHDLLGS